MLTTAELNALDAKIAQSADRIIGRVTRRLVKPRAPNATGPKPVVIQNCIQPEMLDVLHAGEDNWPLWVDDVLSGVARLDWYRPNERSIPLSAKNILRCFAYLDVIDVYSVSHLLHLGKRQATYYFKACQLVHEKLIDGFCNDAVRSLHYPEVFVYPREINESDLGD